MHEYCMENYPKILCHMSLISDNRRNISLLTFLVTLFLAYHALLNLGIKWFISTLQSIVLLRHNPINFVSAKLAINFFSYRNLLFVS